MKFLGFFKTTEIKNSDYKDIHTFDNGKYYLIELYSKKELSKLNKEINIRHYVMSYGNNNCLSKFITNINTLKYLAINENENKLYRISQKFNNKQNLIEMYTYYEYCCFVEYKTEFYRLNFDFDYKYDKYPDIYKEFEDKADEITEYILKKIIDVLKSTLILTKNDFEYIWANKTKSHGHHIYFYNIIVNKILHYYIFSKTIELIKLDNIYPIIVIQQNFCTKIKIF